MEITSKIQNIGYHGEKMLLGNITTYGVLATPTSLKVNGVKFGLNSDDLCSVSSDLTLRQWDFRQQALIETFYEHNADVLDIDHVNAHDFLSSGNDHQAILWRT